MRTPLPALALCLLLISAPLRAEVRTHVLPIDPTGKVTTEDLLEVLLRECGSKVEVPDGAVGGTLQVSGITGVAVLLGVNLLLGPLGVSASIGDSEFRLAVDDDKLRQHVDDLEAALRTLFGADPTPTYALERVEGSDPKGPPVVLVHGLDSGPERMMGAARAIAAAGYDTWMLHYPDDGRIVTSAKELGRLLRELHAERKKRISLVSVSMGGVVARTYLETDPDYSGEVARFIACCPPFGGSPMARYHVLAEITETLGDLVAKGFDGFFIFDGLGQGAADLLPKSALMRRLAKTRRKRGVRYAILAGRGSIVPLAGFVAAESVLDALRQQAEPSDKLTLDLLREVVTTAKDVSGTRGDGAVTLKSQELRGVKDRVILDHHHLEFLAGDGADPAEPIPALAEVLKRLPKP